MWGELARSFQNGNVYIWAMLVLGFIAIFIAIERFIMLQFIYNINFSKFINNLKKMIASKDMERALTLCKTVSNTSLPKIAFLAIEAKENDPTSVKGTLEEYTLEFLPKLETRISSLPALATVILLFGVLGTIDSLWWAFHSLDVLDTAKKQASLANGIASSLNPTAFGLLVAMIILTAHQFIKSIAVSLLENIQHGVAILFNLLVPADMPVYTNGGSIPIPQTTMMAEKKTEPSSSGQATQTEVQKDDAFDDSSVEDIKDEEEII